MAVVMTESKRAAWDRFVAETLADTKSITDRLWRAYEERDGTYLIQVLITMHYNFHGYGRGYGEAVGSLFDFTAFAAVAMEADFRNQSHVRIALGHSALHLHWCGHPVGLELLNKWDLKQEEMGSAAAVLVPGYA